MRNSLSDLNNYLFAQMERLDDDDISDDRLEKEIKRSKATADIANMIIQNAKIQLEAAELAAEYASDNGKSGAIAASILGIEEKK